MRHLHGGDIYRNPDMLDYSANLNPLGMPDSVRKAAKKGVDCSDVYPDVECAVLRQKLSEKHKIPYENIICGNGAADLIFSLAGGLRPERALVLAPTFAEYEQALRAFGCEVFSYFLREEHSFLAEEDYLAYLEGKNVDSNFHPLNKKKASLPKNQDFDLIFLCNPNNPTGQIIEKNLLLRILEHCKKKGCIVVLDECFVDFLDEPEENSMISYLKQYPNLFILKAFTKMYAMAGLRLGYGLCMNLSILEKMSLMMQPWNVSIPAQMAGIAALEETAFVEESRAYIKAEKIFLLENLEKMVEKIYGYSGNYIFFRDEEMLLEKMKQRGILLRDCSNYENLGAGYYRMAVRTREENIHFLHALKEIKDKHIGI